MTATGIALVLLAALAHATWNLLAKRARAPGPLFVFAYSAVAAVLYLPWAAVEGWTWQGWSPAAAGCLIASAVLHLAYSLVLQRGYAVADLSVVYPVARGTGPLVSALAAIAVFTEAASAGRLAGLAAIVAGIVLIASDGGRTRLDSAEGRRGVAWGLATGALIAAYTLVDAWGVKRVGIPPVVLDWTANVLRLAMLAPTVFAKPRALASLGGDWRLAAGVGLLAPLGYILVLGALERGAPVSAVAPLRESSMMIGALFGMLLLGERASLPRLGGCAAILLGVALIALA